MRKLAVAAVVLCLALYALTVAYDRRLRAGDPVGYRNLKTCFRLAPGGGEAELEAAFGAPTRRVRQGAGELLEFRTLSAASAPIRAEIDAATKKTLALWCRDDREPTWRVPQP